jgi:hypothetical protein
MTPEDRVKHLEAALTDLRDHGLRFDLIPTHRPGDEEFWHDYIRRMDNSARERARHALEGA